MGREKGDDRSEEFYSRGKGWKYKGRAKGWDNEILAKADAIISGKTIQEWQKDFNISPLQYKLLQTMLIKQRLEMSLEPVGIRKAYPEIFKPAIIKKMQEEVEVLFITFSIFLHEIEKAEKEGNTTFLNIVREVFQDEASQYTNFKSGRGEKPRMESILKSYIVLKKWLDGEKTVELPKTFYQRDKLKGLCYLAYNIHTLLYEQLNEELEELRVIKKIRLLCEKYNLEPKDIFSKAELSESLQSGKTSRPKHIKENKTATKKEWPKTFEDYMDRISKRQKEVEEQLAQLKDI